MIKMLQSGLPEKKDYLDAILNETIVCNIPANSRKWITNITKFELNKELREKYNNIKLGKMSSEKMYLKLAKLLYDEFDYVECIQTVINKITDYGKNNRRALIYAKSKKGADHIASKIDNVSRFPLIDKTHVVASESEATYGLNQLVIYDTLICYPDKPDLIPQKKGRIDRPTQKSNTLYIEYIIVKDTIEEAYLVRLEMMNNFYKNHIMPIADFYNLAITYK